MELKEKEVNGEWLTVERMQKSGEYSKYSRSQSEVIGCVIPHSYKICMHGSAFGSNALRQTIASIVAYCEKFPQALVRKLCCNLEPALYVPYTGKSKTQLLNFIDPLTVFWTSQAMEVRPDCE